MKVALIGADEHALALAQWAVHHGGHELVAAYDADAVRGELAAIAPHLVPSENWESLITGTTADAVIVGRGGAGLAESGISDSERRGEQLRKLAQAAVPMIVVCPACEAIVGFEIEMIRRDTHALIVPYVPGASQAALSQLQELISQSDASPIGRVEQITLDRELADRSRESVLVQLARDVAIVRCLLGMIRSVTASGPAAAVGRDPLGPKPKELPQLANLSVHLTGDDGRLARWSVGPALDEPLGRLTLIGTQGKAELQMPGSGDWRLAITGEPATALPRDPTGEGEQVFSWLAEALRSGELYDSSAWLDACRDQEVTEAVDRSLLRGRTIELLNEAHSERDSFKGVMAMGGCLLLLMALAAVFFATVVEGLRLPMRNWHLWRLWPIYLLVPIAAFLLLQLLQLAVKREDHQERRLLKKEAVER